MKFDFNIICRFYLLTANLCRIFWRKFAKLKMNKLSINQFILYTLTKTISYNEAYEKFTNIFKNVNSENHKDILKKIPKKKPLYGDELN